MLGFGHLLPHAVESLQSIGADTSLAFKFTLVGYLIVFFFEKIAFNSHSILHSVMDGHEHNHDHRPHAKDNNPSIVLNGVVGLHLDGHDHGHGHDHDHHSTCTLDHDHRMDHCASAGPVTKGSLSSRSAIILLLAMALHRCVVCMFAKCRYSMHQLPWGDGDEEEKEKTVFINRCFLFGYCDVFFSLFETMALGLAVDSTSAALMAASIGLHQPAESVALLVAFLKTPMPRRAVAKWLGLFSLVGPLGVSLGVLIKGVASPLVDAIIVAVTAGTFLYLGATEVRAHVLMFSCAHVLIPQNSHLLLCGCMHDVACHGLATPCSGSSFSFALFARSILVPSPHQHTRS